jgi:hypothetical protein
MCRLIFNQQIEALFGALIKPNLALKYGTRTEKHIFVKPSLFKLKKLDYATKSFYYILIKARAHPVHTKAP